MSTIRQGIKPANPADVNGVVNVFDLVFVANRL